MNKKIRGYLVRFVLLHVVTYLVCGIIFMELQDYGEMMATMEYFQLYRDLETPLVAASIIPMQILRGGLLALFLYPFFSTIMEKKYGWLLLFGVLYIFTRGVIFIIPGIMELVTDETTIAELLFGSLEVTVQMFVFSWLFFRWERKKYKKEVAG